MHHVGIVLTLILLIADYRYDVTCPGWVSFDRNSVILTRIF